MAKLVRPTMKNYRKLLWYKVTTCKGGPLFGIGRYKLSRGSRPGPWVTINGELRMCARGWHATRIPRIWKSRWDQRIFVVQVKGFHGGTNKKSLFRHMRFLRELKRDTRAYNNAMNRRMRG